MFDIFVKFTKNPILLFNSVLYSCGHIKSWITAVSFLLYTYFTLRSVLQAKINPSFSRKKKSSYWRWRLSNSTGLCTIYEFNFYTVENHDGNGEGDVGDNDDNESKQSLYSLHVSILIIWARNNKFKEPFVIAMFIRGLSVLIKAPVQWSSFRF